MNNIFEAIADIARLTTDLIELESIGLDASLRTARGRTWRLIKGDMVRVAYTGPRPYLVDVIDDLPATHLVLQCKGTIYSTDLQVVCEDLDTEEIVTVKL